jgi:Alginate lyase
MRKHIIPLLFFFLHNSCCYAGNPLYCKVKKILEKAVLARARAAMMQEPLTITAQHCNRSAGGLHDFFSEGDYWWPNPNDLDGPYIQKDGLSNPDNFTGHRKAMTRFSEIIGILTSAYLITKDVKYIQQAAKHLRAWFIDTATLMNPSLFYAQAIKGKATGRSIGIIDMIQLLEVAQGVYVMQKARVFNPSDLQKIKNWFSQYLQWVTTDPFGIEEREAKNNHATCWVMQVAVFAKLAGKQQLLADCVNRFKTILLPLQMDGDGSFPMELKRTKPYGYSLFNLDAMVTICQSLSTKRENLWNFTLKDKRSLRKAVEYMYPFVKDKSSWTHPPDIMFWNDWPVAHPFLLFGYEKYHNKLWFELWKKLEHFPQTEEVVRNLPVRNPLIWLGN